MLFVFTCLPTVRRRSHSVRSGCKRYSDRCCASDGLFKRSQREASVVVFEPPRLGEFKQMIATLEAREAEHRKSGKSSSYLGWMLPGGGDAPSPAAADKEGKRDGDAGAASSSFSSMLFGPSSSSSSAPDDADAARVASLVEAFNK